MVLREKICELECAGKDGKQFTLYKFRTMEEGTHKNLTSINHSNLNHYGKPIKDFRVTKKGKVLRKYWIDEFPQVLNFFQGHMKFVGIRPQSKSWSKVYPEDIQRKANLQKPGVCGVQYAFREKGGFDICCKNLKKYFKEYDKHPLETDLKYFFIIAYNILFRGVRSS